MAAKKRQITFVVIAVVVLVLAALGYLFFAKKLWFKADVVVIPVVNQATLKDASGNVIGTAKTDIQISQ